MYIKGKNRARHTNLPTHPKKHHKPYRIRHVGLLLAGMFIVILSVFGLGYLSGRSGVNDQTADQAREYVSSVRKVKSNLGYSFNYDTAVFSASGLADGDPQVVTGEALSRGNDLTHVYLLPRNLSVHGQEALSELEIRADKDAPEFERYQTAYGDTNKALEVYFALDSDEDFTVEKIAQKRQRIGSVGFERLTYKHTPSFGDGQPVFSMMWVAEVKGKPIRVYLKNLVEEAKIPSIYGQVFDSLRFGPQKNSEVLADTTGVQSFDVDRVSPAAVKVYHFVCGRLIVNGTPYGQDACDGGAGSGFLVSSDGHIATSGHVVVLEAADILVSQLLSNPKLLQEFTAAAGLSPQQSARRDVVASVLAKIYDLPSDNLRLDNRREATFIALGSRPIKINSQKDAKAVFNRSDDDYIKRARIIAVDYQPKDLLVIEQQTQEGFSASDMALIKVDVENAPFIRLADSNKISQTDPVRLIGFPADADNQLTKNTSIVPSITSGTVNSIREAKGSSSLLFQTDADASEGSSGGPAIDQDGRAFGLVTYRFKSGNEADAAKSYIRDIADFKDLADDQNISFLVKSDTQQHWEEGLELFKSDRFSKSLGEFNRVQQLYPAHRLAGKYISDAKEAIREGRDKKDPPYVIIGIIGAGIGGGLLVFISGKLIANHRRHHLAYKNAHANNQRIVTP